MTSGDWWRSGVLYQVYVPSFQDGNDDGFGDLPGVERRLDYIADLGVAAIWLSPIYESPLLDFGYDVSGYTAVGPVFGDLPAFDRVVAGAHARGLRVLLDYVPQHTSSEHPWFRDALTGRSAEHRDWYLWQDPAPGGGAPNNWASAFGGSAWTLHEPTGQYYYHAHLPEQPSLNWRNSSVKRAMFDVLRFWLDRGVDGFRVDAAWRLLKDEQLRDNPDVSEAGDTFEIGGASAHTTARQVQKYTADQPELPGLLREMHEVVGADGLLIGELHLPLARVAAIGGDAGLDLAMNFSLIDVPWTGSAIAALVERYERSLSASAWPNWVLSNHDRPRLASRIPSGGALAALALLLTLRGTPTLYYGDELGLPDSPVEPPYERDCAASRSPGMGLGRDPQRMPMPWANRIHASFTPDDVVPWLPIPAWAAAFSVERQSADDDSVLERSRALLRLRRAEPALQTGEMELVSSSTQHVMYTRRLGNRVLLVAINLVAAPLDIPLPPGRWKTLWKSHLTATDAAAGPLGGHEAWVLARSEE